MKKTKYPGVYTREKKSKATRKSETIYYASYWTDDPTSGKRKKCLTKVGSNLEGMTAAKANRKRTSLIEGREKNRQEKREEAKRNSLTLKDVFEKYQEEKGKYPTSVTDRGNFKRLPANMRKKRLVDIEKEHIDNFKKQLKKDEIPAQTQKHILSLIVRLSRFAEGKNHKVSTIKLCDGLKVSIPLPMVDNESTENLTDDQLKALWKAIEADKDRQAATLMKLALYTGMRRTEMLKLQWSHIIFQSDYIDIIDPKGGKNQQIPMNSAARKLLLDHQQKNENDNLDSTFIFPGKNGGQRSDMKRAVNRIRKAAKLPTGFRPLHGLRHVFASTLASSGKVSMYELQKLLTHKDQRMTQRYSHLADKALKSASNVAGDFFSNNGKGEKNNGRKTKKTFRNS
jgi:integrase